jgi:hypothetical protein
MSGNAQVVGNSDFTFRVRGKNRVQSAVVEESHPLAATAVSPARNSGGSGRNQVRVGVTASVFHLR